MQLRVYGRFSSAEIAAMSDKQWQTELAHVAVGRQAERNDSLNDAIKLEVMKRGGR